MPRSRSAGSTRAIQSPNHVALRVAAFVVSFGAALPSASAPVRTSPPATGTESAPPPASAPRWVVSVDVRPRSADVRDRLRSAVPIDLPPGVDGIAVLELPDAGSAAAWVFAAAFARALPREPATLALGDAPAPGSGLRLGDDARVHAIIVTRIGDAYSGAPDRRAQAISEVAASAGAHEADLMVESAPLFAAPAAVLPPASERHALVPRTADVWTLGHVDRCTGDGAARRCLHWAQIVARTGDRFVFGYLPAMWLAARDRWSPAPDRRPRAQLVRSSRVGEDARLLLLVRDADGALHRRPVAIACEGDAWPAATLAVSGRTATISVPASSPITLPLDASLDARPEDL